MAGKITAEQVTAIGTAPGTDTGQKNNPEVAQLQALVNLTDVMKTIAIILIDIRDGRK